MRRHFALPLLALMATGCPAHWENLKKADREQSFVLAKDYTRTERRGIGVKWVEGLRAGAYRLAAEDDDGLYFRGEGACVVKLNSDNADEYLQTGTSKAGFMVGGLWLPRKGVEKDPRLFYVVGGEVNTAQVAAASTVAAPPTTAAVGVGGALVGAIIASGKGEVLFINFGSEKGFVANLHVTGL